MAHAANIRIESGSLRGTQSFFSVLGQPWFQQTSGRATLFVLLRRGLEKSDAALSFVARGVQLPLSCPMVKNCVPDFDQWKPGTSRLLIITVIGPLSGGPYDLNLRVEQTGGIDSVHAFDVSQLKPVTVSSNTDVERTLKCLIEGTGATARSFQLADREGRRQNVEVSTGISDVKIDADENGLWILPADVLPNVLNDVRGTEVANGAGIVTPDPFEADMSLDGRLRGIMMFPYMSRTDGLPPGIGALVDAPLAAARPSAYTDLTKDPADGVRSPKAIWFGRHDAIPVVFSYVKDNYIAWNDRIVYTSFAPIAWRIDVPAGRQGGGPATIWRFAVNMISQGLLLGAGCEPPRNLPAIDTVPLATAVATFQPIYEAARFIPFWSTIVSAVRTSASPDSELAFSAYGQPIKSPVIMDDAMRAQTRMRAARLGMELVLIGLMLHAGLMIWFRIRASKASSSWLI